jgi:hypothetical protein
MACNRPTHCPVFRKHEQSSNKKRAPAEALGSNHAREPDLDVEWPQESFDRSELALNFDDQQRPRRRVPSEDVYRSAIAKPGKCHFELNSPAKVNENGGDGAYEKGVSFVEEAVDSCSIPLSPEPKRRVHRRETASKLRNCHAR